MSRLLSIAVLAVLACSAVQARSDDPSIVAPKAPTEAAPTGAAPTGAAHSVIAQLPPIHSAPEFHAAAAVAALTLLLGGVAVLKGWRHE